MNTTAYPWVEYLKNAKTIDQLRHDLNQRYPYIHENLDRIAIIGAAEEGQRLVQLCDQHGIEVVCICDDRPEKQGLKINQHQIKSTDDLAKIDKAIPIIIASHRVGPQIKALKDKGHHNVALFAVLQILQKDKFPAHMFYNEWLEALFNHRDQIDALIALLEDEQSLQVLNAVLGFRFTLDPEVLAPIIDWDVYGAKDIVQFGDNEVYIDGGCFDGDSINVFIDNVNGRYQKIYGFEPDTQTFKQLQNNFEAQPNVELINKGIYSHSDTLYFDNAGTRGSIFTHQQQDSIAVPVCSIDETLQGQPVTYIKMNIEGAERPALKGAEKSIARHKPTLAISAYHYPSDLWELPLFVKQLHQEYKLYLRQHDSGSIETVLYAT